MSCNYFNGIQIYKLINMIIFTRFLLNTNSTLNHYTTATNKLQRLLLFNKINLVHISNLKIKSNFLAKFTIRV